MADVIDPADCRPVSGALPPRGLRRLPLGWAAAFLVYLVAAFVLMAQPHIFVGGHVLKLFNVTIVIADLHEFFFRYSVLGLGLVPLIFVAEIWAVGWANSSIRALADRKDLTGRSDFVCFLLVHFHAMRWPQVFLTFGFALLSGEMVQSFATEHLGIHLSYGALSPWLRFPLFFLMYTLFDYIAHRVDHSDLFWPLHRFHHAAEEFNVLTADRGHPASTLTQSGLKVFPLVVLGVPAEAIVDIGMLVAAINYLNHSRIDWDFGWFGRYVIQSPRHHQLHHARIGQVSNYSVCPLWDRLGGTWREATVEAVDMGVEDSYAHGWFIVTDMWRDYRDFLRAIAKAARNLVRPSPRTRAAAERPPMETAATGSAQALEVALLPEPLTRSDTQLMVR